MARFTFVHWGLALSPVDLNRQIQPAGLALVLCPRVEREPGLSHVPTASANDAAGSCAFDPAVVLIIAAARQRRPQALRHWSE